MTRKSRIDRFPLALFSALLMGGAVAFFFLAMPMVLLEQGVIASGLPSLIAAAGPPLGAIARTLVAGSLALLAGATTGAAITLIGIITCPRRRAVRDMRQVQLPAEWHLEAYPDANARRPILASSELGVPMAEAGASVDKPSPELPADDALDLVDPLPEEIPAPSGAALRSALDELQRRAAR